AFGKPGFFRLPHEDEWEYAARGGRGNKQPFYWGTELNGTQANTDGTLPFGTTAKGPYLKRTCAVDDTNNGKYPAHPWGLMHMHVWEWCDNIYEKTTGRVMRGGSLSVGSYGGRAAHRTYTRPDATFSVLGCRIRLVTN